MNKTLLATLCSAYFLFGCEEAYDPPTAEEIKQNRLDQEAEYKAFEDAQLLIAKQVREADDSELRTLLANCRSKIIKRTEELRSQSNSIFPIHIIDETSTDAFQYLAGADAIESDEKRIESVRISKEDPTPINAEYAVFVTPINTEYAVLTLKDSFSGPKRHIDNYKCKIGPNLTIKHIL